MSGYYLARCTTCSLCNRRFRPFLPGKQGRRTLSQPIITPCIPQSLGMTSSAGNDTEQGYFPREEHDRQCAVVQTRALLETRQPDQIYVSRLYASSRVILHVTACEGRLTGMYVSPWFAQWFPCRSSLPKLLEPENQDIRKPTEHLKSSQFLFLQRVYRRLSRTKVLHKKVPKRNKQRNGLSKKKKRKGLKDNECRS